MHAETTEEPPTAKEKISIQTRAQIEMDDLESKAREGYQKESEQAATSGNDMMAAFLAKANEKSNEQKLPEETAVTSENVVQEVVKVQKAIEDASKTAESAEPEKDTKAEESQEGPASKDGEEPATETAEESTQ